MLFSDNEKIGKLITRFRLEPRASSSITGNQWLVAFDTQTGKYVTEPGYTRYKRFESSDEAWKYLTTII